MDSRKLIMVGRGRLIGVGEAEGPITGLDDSGSAYPPSGGLTFGPPTDAPSGNVFAFGPPTSTTADSGPTLSPQVQAGIFDLSKTLLQVGGSIGAEAAKQAFATPQVQGQLVARPFASGMALQLGVAPQPVAKPASSGVPWGWIGLGLLVFGGGAYLLKGRRS